MDTRMKTIKLKIGYDNVPSDYTGIIVWEKDGSRWWYKNGNLHREDGPAYIDSSGYEEWWLNGKNYFSESEWKKELEKLKKKSPIKKKIEKKIDSKVLKLNSKKDSIPENYTGIIKWDYGNIEHYENGNLHREDGPAYIDSSGYKEWWLHGRAFDSESEWKKRLPKLNKEKSDEKKLTFENCIHQAIGIPQTVQQKDLADYGSATGFFKVMKKGSKDAYFMVNLVKGEPKPFSKTKLAKLYSLVLSKGPGFLPGAFMTVEEADEIESFSQKYLTDEGLLETDVGYYVDNTNSGTPVFGAITEEYEVFAKAIKTYGIMNSNVTLTDEFKRIVKTIGKKPSAKKVAVKTPKQKAVAVKASEVEPKKAKKTNYTITENEKGEKHIAVDNDLWFIETDSKPEWWQDFALRENFTGSISLKTGAIIYVKNGLLHRDDGPAYINEKLKIKEWYKDDKFVSAVEPKLTVDPLRKTETIKDVALEVNLKNKKENPTVESPANLKKIITSDARETAKRLAVRKISNMTNDVLISLLSKTKKTSSIKDFLNSPIGRTLHGIGSSFIIENLKSRIDSKYQDLLGEIAREFRIQAETELALEAVSTLEKVIKQLFSNESEAFQTRVVVDNLLLNNKMEFNFAELAEVAAGKTLSN